MVTIALRPTTREDEPFLRRVYGGTRAEELALTDWDDARKEAFVAMQFTAQHRYYAEQYAGARFAVILAGGEPVGRLYVARLPGTLRIVDIALLPEYRNRGIGTHLLRDLLAEGTRDGLPVSIHVERFNPALRLYDRLGFRTVADRGVYLLLEWRPDQPTPE